jgi:glycosyltransferase involved in cell wall biosynthesis
MKRIAVLCPYPFLDSVPVLVSMIRRFSEVFIVDVYTIEEPEFLPPVFNSPNINVISEKIARPKKFFQMIVFWMRLLLFIKKSSRAESYQFAFGVDRNGIILTRIFHYLNRCPYAYLSLEINYDTNSQKRIKRIFKWLERKSHHGAQFVIALDQVRGEELEKENGVTDKPVFVLPNILLPAPDTSRDKSRDILGEKFQVSGNKIRLLHCGHLGPAMMVDTIIGSAGDWPDEWVLIIHSRGKNAYADFTNNLARHPAVQNGKARLSLEPYSNIDFDRFVGCCHIGFALSGALDRNSLLTGLSSGKMLQYLKCGIPVIVNLPIETGFVEEWCCGVSIDSGKDIKPAIEKILNRYALYSKNAKRAFAHVMEMYDREVDRVIAFTSES